MKLNRASSYQIQYQTKAFINYREYISPIILFVENKNARLVEHKNK